MRVNEKIWYTIEEYVTWYHEGDLSDWEEIPDEFASLKEAMSEYNKINDRDKKLRIIKHSLISETVEREK